MAVLRWLLIGFGALLLLIVLLIGGALLLVDTRDIQRVIAEQVEEQTGRELHFEGDLSLSFFPWLGFELGATRLANAEGFAADGPFAAIGTTELRIQVMPLFRREIVVDTIVLRDVEANIGVDAAGRTNWADIEARLAASEAEREAEPDEPGEERGDDPLAELPFDLRVEGFELTNAAFNWRDRQTDTVAAVRALHLTTGPLELGRETPVSLRVTVETGDGLNATLSAESTVEATLSPLRAGLRDLVLEAAASGPDLPEGGIGARVEADIDADLDAGRAQIDPLRVTLADTARGSGHVHAVFAGEVPTFEGRLDFPAFNLRDLAGRLDAELPEMADPDTLKAVGFTFDIHGTPDEVALEGLQLTLDETRVDGELMARLNEAVPRISARFEVDAIDVDRYVPVGADEEPGEEVEEEEGESEDPIAGIPREAFHAVNADARLSIARLGYSGLDMTDVLLSVVLEDGLLVVQDSGGTAAGGRIGLDARFDARGDEPAVGLSTRIDAVQAEPLLQAFMDRSPLLGRFDSSITLETTGGTLDAWLSALDGDLSAQFGEGVFRGFNVRQSLRNASLRARGQAEEEVEESGTPFRSLVGSARIRDGVLTTRAFNLEGEGLRGTGEGSVDFGQRKLDYTTSFTVTRALLGEGVSADQRLEGLTVPIRFHGDLFSPRVSVDLTSALRARAREEVDEAREAAEREAQRAREEAERRLREEREKQEEHLERERDKAREKLEERARDLLGR